jgi:hypothetical protein
VGVNVASAAHRSQNTVAVPYDVLAPNDTFVSRKPYVGCGAITAAAHAVVDIAYLAVFETPERTPPGAVVVSTSTTVELPTCGCCVASGVRVNVAVGEVDLVAVTLGVCVSVIDGVALPDAPELGVAVLDGVGLGVGCTIPWM